MRLLCFTIEDHRYGIDARTVVEIVRAVAITPLPEAPAVIEGVIDVRGSVVPVFDLRARFGLPERRIALTDHFILARTPSRVAALHVDQAQDLVVVDDRLVSELARQLPSARHVSGAVTLGDGMVLIHDVATFLSAAESEALTAALTHVAASETPPAAGVPR